MCHVMCTRFRIESSHHCNHFIIVLPVKRLWVTLGSVFHLSFNHSTLKIRHHNSALPLSQQLLRLISPKKDSLPFPQRWIWTMHTHSGAFNPLFKDNDATFPQNRPSNPLHPVTINHHILSNLRLWGWSYCNNVNQTRADESYTQILIPSYCYCIM
jgi:hypothetical protein